MVCVKAVFLMFIVGTRAHTHTHAGMIHINITSFWIFVIFYKSLTIVYCIRLDDRNDDLSYKYLYVKYWICIEVYAI
jgi:hypothetical protein